jgi:16S rRNA G966 N2-methylase RsmD
LYGKKDIRDKFGADFSANDVTYRMGLDVRFANHFADRIWDKTVLETCTGGGSTTIALARMAKHVYSGEIDGNRMLVAVRNANIAGIVKKIIFINSDVFDVRIEGLPETIDAAFIDPDWADSSENRRFTASTTRPPSDKILSHVARFTKNMILIQPPYIDESAFRFLSPHECERLYLSGNHELYGLYFGDLAKTIGNTEFRI